MSFFDGYSHASNKRGRNDDDQNGRGAKRERQGEYVPKNHIILMTIRDVKYNITTKTLHKVCSPVGKVVRIVIFGRGVFQAMVEFGSKEMGEKAMEELDGCDIYSGCCTIRVEYAKTDKLNVKRNDDMSWDFTNSDRNQGQDGSGSKRTLLNEPPEELRRESFGRDQGNVTSAMGGMGGGMGGNMGSGMGEMHGSMGGNFGGNMDAGLQGGGRMGRNMGGGMGGNMDGSMGEGMNRGMGGGMGGNLGGGMDRGMGRNMGGGMDRGMGGNMGSRMEGNMGGRMEGSMGGGISGMERGMNNMRGSIGDGRQMGRNMRSGMNDNMDRSGNDRGMESRQHTLGCVLIAYGFNMDKMTCQGVFNLFCQYGNVLRINFVNSGRAAGSVMVQMSDPDAVDRVMANIKNLTLFSSSVRLDYSKAEFIGNIRNPQTCWDGTPTFMDFEGSRKNRFDTPDRAAKNRIVPPTKTLHFYNLPKMEDEELCEKFADQGAVRPQSIKWLPYKNERSVSGIVEFDDIVEASEALVLVNHMKIEGDDPKRPYDMKLCFSPKYNF